MFFLMVLIIPYLCYHTAMDFRQIKKYLPWILPCVFTACIFYNSLQQGTSSGNLSKEIALILMRFIPFKIDFDSFHHFVRKLAHFSEYFVLAGTVLFAKHSSKEKRNLPVCAFWFLVPVIDEAIQHFVPGRYGTLKDSALDMCGFGTMLLISFLLKQLKSRSSRA